MFPSHRAIKLCRNLIVDKHIVDKDVSFFSGHARWDKMAAVAATTDDDDGGGIYTGMDR